MNNCPICNETEQSALISFGKWCINKCSQCDIGILDPMPDPNEMEKLYNKEYYSDQYDDGLDPNSIEFTRRISQEGHRTKFIRSVKKNGNILDLGCGQGYFMYACRKFGYNVQGADISKATIDYVMDRLRIPIQTGEFEELEFPKSLFDIITMWHFLEHTIDPNKCLHKALHWLKPDGILVIDVPNYESTDAKHYWADWVGWQVPFHRYHFSPTALGYLLKQHDLTIIRKKDYHSEYIKERISRIPLFSIFSRTIAKFYSGTSIAVVAQRS